MNIVMEYLQNKQVTAIIFLKRAKKIINSGKIGKKIIGKRELIKWIF